MNAQNLPKTIIVTGDATLDWHIVNKNPEPNVSIGWNPSVWTKACAQMGGAALLGNLVQTSINAQNELASQFGIKQPDYQNIDLHPCSPDIHHTYALWSQHNESGKSVWRVDQFLGMDSSSAYAASGIWQSTINYQEEADIIVIDDANMGFRDHPELWPNAIKEGSSPGWILLKMAKPITEGKLWNYLLENHADKLIVIIPVEDLRRSEVNISRGLSWERTAQDISWELIHNPAINSLASCREVIVSFDTAGAILLSKTTKENPTSIPKTFLFFDPSGIEGVWKQSHPGLMIGYTTCLAGSIANQLALSMVNPDIKQGIQRGLNAIRRLHLDGYALDPQTKTLGFPLKRIVDEITQQKTTFSQIEVQHPVFSYSEQTSSHDASNRKGWWTILEDQHRENLNLTAKKIVLTGIGTALNNVPQGKFGHLLSVDRREIESFRSIHNLALEYLSKERQKRPLTIAVFGAPGSGKSFGITQVAKTLAPDRLEVLEFNLSQFAGPDEIIDALHLVRDVILSGGIPLVFWDEFDTPLAGKPLGWLRYFLAPMQDGAFREGQIVHPIGKSIFVFAGGTSHTIDAFGKDFSPDEYRAAKVPDFISRLKGFVNILGPNPPESFSKEEDSSDPYYIIRRAIIIRSLLERGAPQLFSILEGQKTLNIDNGVLEAFLNIKMYRHGIRSIETIMTMSGLSGKRAYERSCLPPSDQLELHVNANEFLSLVQQLKLEGVLLEKLAQAYHKVYQKRMEKETPEGRNVTSQSSKTDSSKLAWDELPENEKDQNRDAVRDIPEKLAKIGFVMIPFRSNQPIFKFPDKDDDLMKLARLEHQRWVQTKEAAGWSYASQTDKSKKFHQSMVPWDQLTEKDKETDKVLVRAIPLILAEAGYTMIKLHE